MAPSVLVVKRTSLQTTNLAFRVRIAARTPRSCSEVDITPASEAGIASSTLAGDTTLCELDAQQRLLSAACEVRFLDRARFFGLDARLERRSFPKREIAGSNPAKTTAGME